MSKLEEAREIIKSSRKIFFFTGAGISVASNIPTFRDNEGIWKKYIKMSWSTIGMIQMRYLYDFIKFKQFLLDIIAPMVNSSPTKAHYAIAELSQTKELMITTQNIDNLHQDSGSVSVKELHGNIYEVNQGDQIIQKLTKEEMRLVINGISISQNRNDFTKQVGNYLNFDLERRPNIVLFGEHVNISIYNESMTFIESCDCLVIVGTSLKVYPAAYLIDKANALNKAIINVGFDEIEYALNLFGTSEELIPKLLNFD